jgi:hypothetical protein
MKEITDKFKIHSYDGGEYNDSYKIDYILEDGGSNKHCSSNGRNFVLVLKFKKKKYSIKQIQIRGGPSCTCPLKTGVMFFSNEKLSVKSLKKRFSDVTDKKSLKKKLEDNDEFDALVSFQS